MKHKTQTLRTAILALFASIVLPTAPVFGQDAPVVAPPPPVMTPAPPPMASVPAPPVAVRPSPAPRSEAPTRAATRSTATRAARTAPIRQAARAAQTPAPVAAPAAVPAPAPTTEPVATAEPTPLPVEATPAPAATETRTGVGEVTGGSSLPWILVGAGLLLAALAFFAFRRRRRDDEVYEDVYDEEPVVEAVPEPSFTRAVPIEPAPAFVPAAAIPTEAVREVEEPEVVEAANEDVEALAAESAPVANRPWIEFLMRPVRAGTSQDDAIVQFELTVGNTGSVEAKDVRISTWMVAAGSGTEHERSLINPPSDAQVSEVDIAAGDGARVEGELAMAKGGEIEPVLPVVHADARYRLPDGSEGRTHAAFAIGLPESEGSAGLTPFPMDRASGLRENVEARLHGEPERV